jgi:hypothetical protein
MVLTISALTRLVLIMETWHVFCAVGTEYMNIIQRNLQLLAGEDQQQFSSKSIMAERVKTLNFVDTIGF